MQRESSIGSRVSQRKRGFLQAHGSSPPAPTARPTSRRKLTTTEYTQDDIAVIKEKFGHYQHHGTGNPLNQRAPSAPRDMAVTNLANIILNGMVGSVSSDSTPKLKTERGSKGSFWTCRLRLAGSYGWTGLVLPSDAKSDNPFPVQNVKYFLVEGPEEVKKLEEKVCDSEKWHEVQGRVITVSQLAELARAGPGAMD